MGHARASAMAHALDLIQQEHRNFATVLVCLKHTVAGMTGTGRKTKLDLVDTIVDYIESFIDRYHHPKERDFLFDAIIRRHPQSAPLFDEIDGEHQRGAELLEQVKASITDCHAQLPGADAALEKVVADYVAFERDHCIREDRHVTPLAESYLTDYDWAKIEAAFASHRDPMFGPEVRANFGRLYKQILSMEKRA